LIRIEVLNRGPESATLDVLPTIWFRNTWSWGKETARPELRESAPQTILLEEPYYGQRWLHCDGSPELLFTGNETNLQALWGVANPAPFLKDGINEAVVHHRRTAINPQLSGTKAAAHYTIRVEPGKPAILRLRLTDTPLDQPFDASFGQIFT